jgi:hypothetical protein
METIAPFWSKIIARELVVPWSNDKMYVGMQAIFK